MANWEWERFGDDIRRTVQDAVDSRNYEKLNQTINNTINQAIGGIGKGLHDAGDAVDKGINGMWNWNRRSQGPYQDHPYQDAQGGPYQGNQGHPYREDTRYNRRQSAREDRYRRRYQTKYGQSQTEGQAAQGYAYRSRTQTPVLYRKTGGVKAGGTALAATGYVLGGGLILGLAFMTAGAFATGSFGTVFRVLAASGIVFLGVSTVLAGIGTSMLGKVRRFRAYIEGMEGKEYGEIKELAQRVKKSPKYVVKDLERMIEKGWFRQGHLDSQKTCLMVTDNAYNQYMELMQHLKDQKKQEEEKKEQQKETDSKLDPQIQEIIRTGDAYIKKIRECNDAIPGPEISAKISRMETLVDRIFDRVEQKPDCATEIRRLMEYYLPTTVKLLEAYEELDAQPVQGDNILSSKKEIEGTLDTLNVAFEKLLDSLFQDTAWDVSADISVLNTMLAQEGLTKDDFK